MNIKNKFLILITSLLGITACCNGGPKKEEPVHEHTFSSTYSYNEIFHWRDATCEHTNEFKDKNVHAFEDWKIEKDSTVFEEGIKSRKCSFCDYKEVLKIEKKYSKGLNESDPFTVSEILKELATNSSFDLTVKYYVTGKVIFAESDPIAGFDLKFESQENGLNFYANNATMDSSIDEEYDAEQFINATIEVYGFISLKNNETNSYCMQNTDDVKPLIVDVKNAGEKAHKHTFESDWSYDETGHWHASTCGHTEEVSNYGKHSFGEWVVDIQPSSTTTGLKSRKCLYCDYKETEIIEKTAEKGTVYNPYSIEEAIALMSTYGSNQISLEQYYVRGKVSTGSYNSKYDSYTLYFEDHESYSQIPFELYSGVVEIDEIDETLDGSYFVGKTITMYGYLKLYVDKNNNKTYEVAYLSASSSPTGNEISPKIVKIETETHEHTYSTVWSKNASHHWHQATCEHTDLQSDFSSHIYNDWIIDTAATANTSGSKHRDCLTCGYRDVQTISPTSQTKSFTVYSFNDFHGAVNEYSSQNHIGLAKFGTFLKQASLNENVLIVDSGDTFQGSIESNYNNGAMITDVFNYAHVDVHTLGNHDFDWGESKIEANKARTASDGWHMTNLAANINDYNFSTHTEGNVQQSRLGAEYYIKTLENGLKVGVIGVIGRDQITSICSPLVEDICFKEHIETVKNLSDKLRNTEGCDFVIASAHEGASAIKDKGLSDVSPVTGKKYCDYVVCGHTHSNEKYEVNGVNYTQAACYGEMIYKAEFTFDSGEITKCTLNGLNYNSVTSSVTSIDSNITNIISEYAKDYSSVGGEVLGDISGNFGKNNELPNMLSKAMYLEAKKEGYSVDLALTNAARYNIDNSSQMTYAQLYEAFPFDNVIYVVKVKGSKNIKELTYSANNCYHDQSFTSMNANTWYTIAVIDYLLWHTNSNRIYDYFDHSSSNMEVLGTLRKNGNTYLYRDICADYIRSLNGTIYSSNYDKYVTEHTVPTYN